MYSLSIKPKVDKIFKKLKKKDQKSFGILTKKIEQILNKPTQFKPLRKNMKGIRRVHINDSFVLIYEIKEDIIILLDYDHHDKIYY